MLEDIFHGGGKDVALFHRWTVSNKTKKQAKEMEETIEIGSRAGRRMI